MRNDQKHGLLAAHHCASWRTMRSYDVLLVSELQQFFLGRLHLVGLREKNHTIWWSAICGGKYDWKQPNRLLVAQASESINQAKVFKAHAVPQGLSGNLIKALKMLANQQEDEIIVTNFGKGCRKGLAEGLRGIVKIDNKRALEVGYLNRGMGKLTVRRPEVPK